MRIKLFREMNDDNLTIKYSDRRLSWYIGNQYIGQLEFMVSNDIAMIIGYVKYSIDIESREKLPPYKGVGYQFILKSFEYLLSKYDGVFSYNRGRNELSNHVWEKISKIYDVEDTTLVINKKSYDGKIIYSKKN